MILPENLRTELKTPLGRLFLESDSEQEEIIKEVYDKREKISGLKILEEPKYLRHFTSHFKFI